jgi:hypothetical protein
MSTKTTFKRVALVAVAAMGIGLLTAVPSNAAPVITNTQGVGTPPASQVVGGQAAVSIALDTMTVTNIAISGVGSVVSSTVSGSAVQSPASLPSGATSWSESTTASAGGDSIVFTSAVTGTTTITATPLDSNGTPLASVTQTITWTANLPTGVVNHSTAFLGAVGSEVLVDATQSPLAAISATAIGQIDVRQYADSGTTPTATASTQAVTVSIAGAGSVSTTSPGGATGPSVTIAAGAGAANRFTFYVYPNGVAGVGTITISVNGVAVATKSVIFAGTLASFKVTPTKTVIGVGSTDVVAVAGLDSNANAAALGTFFATSATPTVATVSVSGATVIVTGVAVGTSVITVANAATSPTITKTFTVTIGKATAKTVTMTLDKATYAPGEKMTLTITALGSDGMAVGDGPLAVFGGVGVTSNVGLQGTLPGTTPTFVGGVATATLYAPISAATIQLVATEGAATDNVIANGTTAAAAITATAEVTGDTSAVDAANAATDAANYAADAADAATTAAEEATAAAQAAQDSADAAMAAVVALALRVNVLYTATRTQVLRLQALLVRLIKKLHA